MIQEKTKTKPIAVDFDGVLHEFKEGWTGPIPEGEPIQDAVWAINKLIKRGWDVVIYTTRAEHKEIQQWLDKHGLPRLPITSEKPHAMAYIDDRGVRFTNWQDIIKYFV